MNTPSWVNNVLRKERKKYFTFYLSHNMQKRNNNWIVIPSNTPFFTSRVPWKDQRNPLYYNRNEPNWKYEWNLQDRISSWKKITVLIVRHSLSSQASVHMKNYADMRNLLTLSMFLVSLVFRIEGIFIFIVYILYL